MAVISKITTQQKNTERFNVFLDNGNGKDEYAFSVDQNVLIKFNLKKGLELDSLDISEIQFDDEVKKGTNTAISFLAHRMRSEKEVVDYLKKKEIEAPIIQEIIHRLYEFSYLNDKDFATAYVRTQLKTTVKGPEVIKRELEEKGIKVYIIEDSLMEYNRNQQVDVAKGIASKLSSKNSRVSSLEQKKKIEQTLLRKGFPWDIINEATKEVEIENDVDDQWEALTYQGEKALRKYQKFEGYVFEQKMKQALYRKGFSIELIDKYLETLQEE
ncbi:recombination regulator RecX [Litchfieldia alkalitelluris]|uniref:recombination regulator RecX n=1 Tax=Litchfieldia alkalitelluris TaxID=304268 RepID=UPI0009971FE0|nr:recombination regulator RecX [Litchfieldia alkalitelluris]